MAVTLVLMQKTIIGPLTRLTEHTIAIGQSGDLSSGGWYDAQVEVKKSGSEVTARGLTIVVEGELEP